jgi:thioredoxin-like negative regulator of GroEL
MNIRTSLTAMTAALVTTSAFAGEPAIIAEWRGEYGLVRVEAPEDEHLADTAEAWGWYELEGERFEFASQNTSLEQGIAFLRPSSRGEHWIVGELSFSLCQNGGSACRLVETRFEGDVYGRRGDNNLVLSQPEAPEIVVDSTHESHGEGSAALAAAFEAAALDGKLVLIDFGAIWCPPCNQLSADILEAPEHQADLEPYHVVALDADDADSWESKDRYGVRGYPTLIVARADGEELDRQEGYWSKDNTLSWLASLAGGSVSLNEQFEMAPEMSDVARGEVAKTLAFAGRVEDAVELILQGCEGADCQIATVVVNASREEEVSPTEESAIWLLENAPLRTAEWLWWVPDLAEASDELRDLVADQFPTLLASVDPVLAAELAFVGNEFMSDFAIDVVTAMSVAVFRSQLTGDPVADRASYYSLIHLYDSLGLDSQVVELLTKAITEFPTEMTFYNSLAGYHSEMGRFGEALVAIEGAVEWAYGDNAIRVAKSHAEILIELGQREEAVEVITSALESAAVPETDLDVRTFTYIERLEQLLESVQSGGEE